MSILVQAQTLLTILSYASEVIQSVEAVSAGAAGADKKTLALSVIRSIYDATAPAVPFDSLYNQVSGIVDALVSFYNTIGKFAKSLKQAA
jgi:hypothetical protein